MSATAENVLPVRQEAIDATAARIAAAEEAVQQAEEWAELVEVTNAGEAQQATEILGSLAGSIKHLEAERTESVKPLNDYVKGVNEKFKRSKAPLEAAASKIKAKLINFNAAEERRRAEEQRRLDAEREEAERIIEERRAADAAKLQAEAETKRAEAAEAVELASEDDEFEEMADEARAEARAADARAETIANLPAPNLPSRQAAPAAKLDGASSTKRWEFEITDIRQVPDFLPDGTPLKALVSGAMRTYMFEYLREHGVPPEMPGVKFEQRAGLAVRS
jgi:colicin import membrane protein